jgi:hypothetical protein
MEHSSRWPNLVQKNEIIHNGYVNGVPSFKSPAAILLKCVIFVLWIVAGVLAGLTSALQGTRDSNHLSIIELENSLAGMRQTVRSFRVEDVVRAIEPGRNIVALENVSGAVLLDLASVSPAVRSGDWLAVEGDHCLLNRSRYSIQAGTAPVVDNDGIHSSIGKSGMVFLGPGMNPIRVEWFYGAGDSSLGLEHEGPELPRQKVPASIWWHGAAGGTNQSELKPGFIIRHTMEMAVA